MAHQAHGTEPRRRHRRHRSRRLKGSHGGGGGGGEGGEGGPLLWLNPAFGSFDDFATSMITLYVMSTGDGWEDVQFAGMDSVGVGVAPPAQRLQRLRHLLPGLDLRG